jgi:hypothetical protein
MATPTAPSASTYVAQLEGQAEPQSAQLSLPAIQVPLLWRERQQQAEQLQRLVGRRATTQGANIFVYGAPKAGKTSIVR